MNTAHPIELFIAALINLFEFICYVINELAGFHTSQQSSNRNTEPQSPSETQTTPHIQPFHSFNQFTVKQLRQLTGINNSRYRKQDLIFQAVACM